MQKCPYCGSDNTVDCGLIDATLGHHFECGGCGCGFSAKPGEEGKNTGLTDHEPTGGKT